MRKFFGRFRLRRRAVPRAELSLDASISAGDLQHPATVIDVSRTGARVAGRNLPQEGQEVTIQVGSLKAPGLVVWSDTNVCAIEFDIPIAAVEVQQLRALHRRPQSE
jgi:hypothetical protein